MMKQPRPTLPHESEPMARCFECGKIISVSAILELKKCPQCGEPFEQPPPEAS